MPIVQACSYTATIKTPSNPEKYSAMIAAFQQNGKVIIVKDKSQLVIQGDRILVQLTQEETSKFVAGLPVFLQLRCYNSPYDAPGSKCWPIDVWPSLSKEVLA